MRAAPVLLAGALLLAGCGKAEPPADAPADSMPAADTPAPAVEPTAAMGEQIFKRCMACHTIGKDEPNGIGPNLHGIVGRAVAGHAGFSYSAALKAKGGNWDAAHLDQFLESPMKYAPGTRMAFAGIIDAADRKALILYLEEQSK
ncbi:cytochrome c family protein [Sphingopyxis sp.]|uniref:c-type cytochrome n=1 Tax=Sphingopyxis sp. TaxID=1908224 RepID=UPI0035B24521